MAEAPRTRQIIVTDLKHIKAGFTSGGEPYTLWQVRATDLGGIPIDQNLRTFEELPKDQPITVSIDWFKSTRGYGDSFTLKQVVDGGASSTSAPPSPPPPVNRPNVDQAIKDLQQRVAQLEEEIGRLKSGEHKIQSRGQQGPGPVW